MNTSKSLDFGYELEDFREAYRKHLKGAEPPTAFVVELLAMQASVLAEQEAAIVEAVEGLDWRICNTCGHSRLDAAKSLPSVRDAIEFRREQYGWTQRKMAEQLGWDFTHYNEFIHGKRGLPYAVACRAFKLGVPPVVLLQEQVTDLVATDKEAK